MDKVMQLIDDFKGKLDMIATVCSNTADAIDLFMFKLEGQIFSSKQALRYALDSKKGLEQLDYIRQHASKLTKLESLHWLSSRIKDGGIHCPTHVLMTRLAETNSTTTSIPLSIGGFSIK